MPRLALILASATLAGASAGALLATLSGLSPAWKHTLEMQTASASPHPLGAEARTNPQREPALDMAGLLGSVASQSDVASQQLQLFGIVTAPSARALIGATGKAPQWFSIGDTKNGVKLITVAPNAVRLDTQEGELVLRLGEPPHAGPASMPLAATRR